MAENKKIEKIEPSTNKEAVVKTIHNGDSYVTEETYVVCKVCGHANKEKQGVCEMCSNFLY